MTLIQHELQKINDGSNDILQHAESIVWPGSKPSKGKLIKFIQRR